MLALLQMLAAICHNNSANLRETKLFHMSIIVIKLYLGDNGNNTVLINALYFTLIGVGGQ